MSKNSKKTRFISCQRCQLTRIWSFTCSLELLGAQIKLSINQFQVKLNTTNHIIEKSKKINLLSKQLQVASNCVL